MAEPSPARPPAEGSAACGPSSSPAGRAGRSRDEAGSPAPPERPSRNEAGSPAPPERPLTFIFGASGWLHNYYVGIVAALRDHGVRVDRCLGSSGGALVASIIFLPHVDPLELKAREAYNALLGGEE